MSSEMREPHTDVEALLRSALRPIEPPESLPNRVEETLTAVTEAAAEELSAWAEELSDSELAALRDPRNWVRPAAAGRRRDRRRRAGADRGAAQAPPERRLRGRRSAAQPPALALNTRSS